MKRSIKVLAWTLAPAALIGAGLGCSRPSQPAQQPTGTSSPPFESNVPPPVPPAPPEPGREQLPQGQEAPTPPPPPGGAATPTPPSPPAPPPEVGAPHGPEQPSAAGPAESERQMCDALGSDAKLHVEDVQHGVAIVVVPRTGHDISAIRDDAHRVETAMRRPGPATSPGAESCGLFAISRLPSVSTSVVEGANAMRILMTTANTAEVKDLRRLAREEVSSLSKGKR